MERPGAANEGYGIKTFQFSRRYKLKLDWTIVASARNAIFKWPACYFSSILLWLPCHLLGEAFFDCLPEREPPSSLPYSILAVYLFHNISEFICLLAFCFGPLVKHITPWKKDLLTNVAQCPVEYLAHSGHSINIVGRTNSFQDKNKIYQCLQLNATIDKL